jgi:predicted RNA methylase
VSSAAAGSIARAWEASLFVADFALNLLHDFRRDSLHTVRFSRVLRHLLHQLGFGVGASFVAAARNYVSTSKYFGHG